MTDAASPFRPEMFRESTDLPVWRVIPVALAAGALTPADVVHHGVMVDAVGRSHAVYRVSIGGQPRFYIKAFGPNRGASDGLPARERAVLTLAAQRAEVAALVPGGWPWANTDADDGPGTSLNGAAGAGGVTVIATEAVPGAEAWTLDHAGGGAEGLDEAWLRLVGALVPPLAALHRSTRDLARPGAAVPLGLEPVEPWGLRLMDGDAAPEFWASPGIGTLLREAATDAQLVAGLRAARALWRPMALIHADLKHDNVLVERSPNRTGAGLRVRVVDWEMARIGDPAWDLAAVTARLLVARGEEAPWSVPDVAAAARLLAAYARASGLTVPPLSRRLVLYTGALLLMMSLQHVSTLPPGADPAPARRLLMRARATLARAHRLTAEVIAQAQGDAQAEQTPDGEPAPVRGMA